MYFSPRTFTAGLLPNSKMIKLGWYHYTPPVLHVEVSLQDTTASPDLPDPHIPLLLQLPYV
jgi:hypothetical protein